MTYAVKYNNFIGLKLKSGLSLLIHEHGLNLEPKEEMNINISGTCNLLAIDLENLQEVFSSIDNLSTIIVHFILVFFYIFYYLRWNIFFSYMPTILITIPISYILSKYSRKSLERLYLYRDEKLKYITELFINIKIIKIYSWIDPFLKNILSIRKTELHWSVFYFMPYALNYAVWRINYFITEYITLTAYIFTSSNKKLTIGDIYSLMLSISFLADFRWIPTSINNIIKTA